MKHGGRAAVYTLATMVAAMMLLTSGAKAADSDLKPAMASLAYFIGDWECAGKFDVSGKAIEAHQRFSPELNGAWLSFRHDDKPPFSYHALAEWGWGHQQRKFMMIALDSVGGARMFYSSGWDADKLQWDGDAVGTVPPKQRFSFERLDGRHFRVSYYTLKNGDWSRVDASTCSKQ